MGWFKPKSWILNSLKLVDKVANKLSGGKEWETISSRLGKVLMDPNASGWATGVAKGICGALNVIDKDHCIRSVEEERVELLKVMHKMKLAYEELRSFKTNPLTGGKGEVR